MEVIKQNISGEFPQKYIEDVELNKRQGSKVALGGICQKLITVQNFYI